VKNLTPQPEAQQRASASRDIPAVLLVGGFGTRLQAVLPSTPKPLARVGDAPFLELLILQLRAQGIRRLVMSTGHLAEQIQQQFGDGRNWDVAIEYSQEDHPLGTAGAVKLAEAHIGQDSDFLVLNGDSFLEADFGELIRLHRERAAMVTMAVCRVPDASRYGTVEVNADNKIVRFVEKTGGKAAGLINGGVYAFHRAVLQEIPAGPSSLEKDVFPRLLEMGMYAVEQRGVFIDIGTPEDYARAQELSRNLRQAVHGLSQ